MRERVSGKWIKGPVTQRKIAGLRWNWSGLAESLANFFSTSVGMLATTTPTSAPPSLMQLKGSTA